MRTFQLEALAFQAAPADAGGGFVGHPNGGGAVDIAPIARAVLPI